MDAFGGAALVEGVCLCLKEIMLVQPLYQYLNFVTFLTARGLNSLLEREIGVRGKSRLIDQTKCFLLNA